ncbi:hypothetical protein DENSPDRAFT_785151 [Dentipellis sp. KUC8613]|nr:hypothetical protein DENSPDRAFT_785151 [Dentipellis sp. KUC8613]
MRKRQEEETRKRTEESQRQTVLQETLDHLEQNDISFFDLLVYAFGSKTTTKHWKQRNLFSKPGAVNTVLNLWISKEVSKRGRRDVKAWAVDTVQQILEREAEAASQTGFLRTANRPINADFVLGLDFKQLGETTQLACPKMFQLMSAVATTQRQQGECKGVTLEHKNFIVTSVIVNLLGQRSQNNNYMQHVLGLYLYATGATRQQISVLNHLGLSVSYTTLAGRGGKGFTLADSVDGEEDQIGINATAGQQQRMGTLEKLSISMRERARQVAREEDTGKVYDNINMNWKVQEQVIGRTSSQENGTCATLIPLFGVTPEALKTSRLNESLDKAGLLLEKDLELTKSERDLLETCLVHAVLRIAVRYGGPELQVFSKEVEDETLVTAHKIPVHKTPVYPLPTMNINEASTSGNAEVVDAILKELRIDTSKPEFAEKLRPIAGDQLSIARLRSVAASRAGNEGGASAMDWALNTPGLFHYKMAASHGILQNHLGEANHDLNNPGSLSAHNTVLKRKPIVLSSLPPFRTCRDLIFTSLYARVLHCLVLVSGKPSLKQFSEDITWEELKAYARQVIKQFTDSRKVDKLRESREFGRGKGDMVFENAILFLRDALHLREFSDAIKSGDSGRVCIILKLFAHSYRGNGRTKYAQEMLHLIHNLTHIWPPDVKDVVLKNWLVNPTGKANSWVEIDLLQEHLNFWIKTFYQAHGSGASWEWLATISPCVEVLRQLATHVNVTLGSAQGNRHAEADLTEDLDELLGHLDHNNVYREQPGRIFGEGDRPAPDAIAAGRHALTWGANAPLKQFNSSFRKLQCRRRIQPLVGGHAVSRPATSPDIRTSLQNLTWTVKAELMSCLQRIALRTLRAPIVCIPFRLEIS